MFCNEKIPKTVEQWVTDGGNLWPAGWAPTGVPSELVNKVQDTIELYINPRRIGVPNDARFGQLWQVNLACISPRFWQLLQAETEYITVADFINTHKIERTYSGESESHSTDTNTGTGTTESTGNNTSKTTGSNDTTTTYGRTDNTTVDQSVSDNGSTTYGRKDTATTNQSNTSVDDAKSRALSSNMPQSNVASETAGLDTDVKWTYATALSDTLATDNRVDTQTGENVNTASGTDTTESSSETTGTTTVKAGGSDTVDSSSTMDVTGTTTAKTDTTTSATNETATTGSESNTETVTETGPVAEIMRQWYNYLLGTASPIKWFLSQIEPLLYGFYDEYEEETV